MSKARFARSAKRQMGQFLTPPKVAQRIIAPLSFARTHRILEPSFGEGAFIFAVVDKLLSCYEGDLRDRLDAIFAHNIYGVELDPVLYQKFFTLLEEKYNHVPVKHNLYNSDFFNWNVVGSEAKLGVDSNIMKPTPVFDYIVGNPPFGGSINAAYQDELDKLYGFRSGEKIKKETYSFFLVKSLDSLKLDGSLTFICSDTFLTINTMRGLRNLLSNSGEVEIDKLSEFSEETTHPMVVFRYVKTGRPAAAVRIGDNVLSHEDINKTKNASWRVNEAFSKYFSGVTLGDYLVATSGMTIGRNDLFLRRIENGNIKEPYQFRFFDDPITLERELGRARLGFLSDKQKAKIREAELRGETRVNVEVAPLGEAELVQLPDCRYSYYNKANNDIVYSPPAWVVYWENEGEAVYTFKKNGNWYLHGVGGKKFFKRSGITWSLVASRMHIKFLPEGYILDSGAPAAFLREGVHADELFFVMGWTLTSVSNKILKEVINHTRNIQGKDFERLPYPIWVSAERRGQAVELIKEMIHSAQEGVKYTFDSKEIGELETLYAFCSYEVELASEDFLEVMQPSLF